jgi:hypothetical protein
VYPLHDLEEEFDYETDRDQVFKAKNHNINETFMAIEFFTKDDPLMLVENLKQEHLSQDKK